MLAVLGASLVPRERDHVHFVTRRLPVEVANALARSGVDSANNVQNQTTCYPYMVTRQRKTGHVDVVIVHHWCEVKSNNFYGNINQLAASVLNLEKNIFLSSRHFMLH